MGRLTTACKHPTLESYYPTGELLPHRRITSLQVESYFPTGKLLLVQPDFFPQPPVLSVQTVALYALHVHSQTAAKTAAPHTRP